VQLVRPLAELTGLTEAVPAAEEAARLARADLATATVTESTALAGVMGAHFARAGGAPEAVAEAIFESVLPRQAGDALPRTGAGTLVAVADRCKPLAAPRAPVLNTKCRASSSPPRTSRACFKRVKCAVDPAAV